MPRKYEVVYIFDSQLEEEAINGRLERFHDLLKNTTVEAPISETSHWGKRTLAYPIQNRDTGYYVVTRFETDPSQLPEFERALKLDEGLLRHLVVVNEGELPRPPRTGDNDGDDSGPSRPKGDA